MKDIILSPIPVEELDRRIENIVERAVSNVGGNLNEIDEIPLIRASTEYGITRQTFYNLHKKNAITLLKLNGRTFVRRSDISHAMKEMERK